ncbi:formyltetrahydrofolate deformylase [Kineobactrum salinum]|uniref:hypothetical protein n=1 Tax=Kineobactrum salinum TaxID=2708301 RepID=UPI0018D5DF23|nr:hypothetical protein [Kineobactrum salinum]
MQAATLLRSNLVWGNYGCLPLRPDDEAFLPQLELQRKSGVDVAMINIGFSETARFVTADLAEGPITEQDVRRVSHAATADEMVAIGREVEASVLSRAVGWYAKERIFTNGNKAVVL